MSPSAECLSAQAYLLTYPPPRGQSISLRSGSFRSSKTWILTMRANSVSHNTPTSGSGTSAYGVPPVTHLAVYLQNMRYVLEPYLPATISSRLSHVSSFPRLKLGWRRGQATTHYASPT